MLGRWGITAKCRRSSHDRRGGKTARQHCAECPAASLWRCRQEGAGSAHLSAELSMRVRVHRSHRQNALESRGSPLPAAATARAVELLGCHAPQGRKYRRRRCGGTCAIAKPALLPRRWGGLERLPTSGWLAMQQQWRGGASPLGLQVLAVTTPARYERGRQGADRDFAVLWMSNDAHFSIKSTGTRSPVLCGCGMASRTPPGNPSPIHHGA